MRERVVTPVYVVISIPLVSSARYLLRRYTSICREPRHLSQLPSKFLIAVRAAAEKSPEATHYGTRAKGLFPFLRLGRATTTVDTIDQSFQNACKPRFRGHTFRKRFNGAVLTPRTHTGAHRGATIQTSSRRFVA